MELGAYTVEFCDLTPAEIIDIINSAAKRRDMLAVFCWHNAYLTGLMVRAPKQFPKTPAEHFNFLGQDVPDWKRQKAKMAQFAAVHNSKFEGGNS